MLTSRYLANPTLQTANMLAEELGFSPRSVIAKLSSMGIYKSSKRVTKNNQPIIKKSEMVAEIEQALGITCESLVKIGKSDLYNLHEVLCQKSNPEQVQQTL